MWKIVFRFCSAAFVLMAATPSMAAPIAIDNAVFKEVIVQRPDGGVERKLTPAAKVTPGDEVVYVLTVRNTGPNPAEQLVVTNPLPVDVVYVASIDGDAPKVSVGGERFAALSELSVTVSDGRTRPAVAADVTHLRWDLASPLASQAEHRVSYRGRLK